MGSVIFLLVLMAAVAIFLFYKKNPDIFKSDFLKRMFSWDGGLKKRFAELSTDLNTYIGNLGFKPTGAYTTIVWMAKNFVDENKFSPATKDVIARSTNLSEKYRAKEPMVKQSGKQAFWFPQMGVFLNGEEKLFAVRSKADETNPKVYKFSQLQGFEVSEDVRESMRGAVAIPYLPVLVGFGGKPSGRVSMRIVFSGTSGPEWVELSPPLMLLEDWKGAIKTNTPLYKIKCEELTLIADCLQWIHNNA